MMSGAVGPTGDGAPAYRIASPASSLAELIAKLGGVTSTHTKGLLFDVSEYKKVAGIDQLKGLTKTIHCYGPTTAPQQADKCASAYDGILLSPKVSPSVKL